MPVFRTADGKIVEEKTKKVDDDDSRIWDLMKEGGQDQLLSDNKSGTNDFYDEPTQKLDKLNQEKVSGTSTQPPVDKEKTRLFGARHDKSGKSDETAVQNQTDQPVAMDDPIVGWLVVIDGPGRGNSLALGYGTNSIGRSEQDRVSLIFGDDLISRFNHAVVTFDPQGKKFYVQHGGGKNLTYLGGSPVLQPTELKDRNDISMGNTMLKFIALCGDDFNWGNE